MNVTPEKATSPKKKLYTKPTFRILTTKESNEYLKLFEENKETKDNNDQRNNK